METIETKAKQATLSLRRILTQNLATQREAGRRHAKKLAKERRKELSNEKQFALLLKRAARGAKRLVQLHKTQEIREVLAVLTEINRASSFKLHQHDIDLGGEYLAWTYSSCEVCMTKENVLLRIGGQIEGAIFDYAFALNSPGGENEPMTIENELEHCCQLTRMGPEGVADAVRAIDPFEEPKVHYSSFLSWFAFLVACADEEKLAKLMAKAFDDLKSAS